MSFSTIGDTKLVYKNYENYEDYLIEYDTYAGDKCDICGGIRELNETEIYCNIGSYALHFPYIFTLKCEKCGNEVFSQYTKEIIDGAYKNMLAENQENGVFTPTDFKKKFNYCEKEDFEYDHKDFYNVPGLRYDDEHPIEGFLECTRLRGRHIFRKLRKHLEERFYWNIFV